SVVQIGVKSFGCEKSTAHESPIQSWKLISPSVVSAVKFGAVSLSCNAMCSVPLEAVSEKVWIQNHNAPERPGIPAGSAVPLDERAGLAEEGASSRPGVARGGQAPVGQSGAAEARIVEERVDPARPGRRVQIRLCVVAVAR